MSNTNHNDQFSELKKLVGKPIENATQLCDFITVCNKAGVEVMHGTEPLTCFKSGETAHVSCPMMFSFTNATWNNTKIKYEKDEYDDNVYHVSGITPWSFNFRFALNCVVTDIDWGDVDDRGVLPTIIICRVGMLLDDLIDEERRREAIMKDISDTYDIDVESIGQVFSAPSKNIEMMDYEFCKTVNLNQMFKRNFPVDSYNSDWDYE